MADGSSSGCEKVFNEHGDKRARVKSTRYPYCCIASLQFIFDKNNVGQFPICNGTGFLTLIDGCYIIVTAAHLAFHEKRIPLSRIQISLGREGDVQPFGLIIKYKESLWLHPKYKNTKKPRNYDVAFVQLNEEDDLLSKGFNSNLYFLLGSYEDGPQYLRMSGYPGSVQIPDAQWKEKTQWEVDVTNYERDGRILSYKNATSNGNSGSPIFKQVADQYYAVGMHLCGTAIEGNKGLIFLESLLKFLKGTLESLMDTSE